MKLKFKHQKFQEEAAKAVCDVFAGQPYLSEINYLIDRGEIRGQGELYDFTGFKNHKIAPQLTDEMILDNIRKIQRTHQIPPSEALEGRYNLTIEMETGTGKTYAYIKTMYELNKRYGWSKFIIVVPSVAIREGVFKSFQITQEHFTEDYSKKIQYFIYNSSQLTEIDRFASDNSLNVMIINAQAFNARGKDARRIYMKLDSFRSRRPIDVIAKTNPILVIDEPQSVEGRQTKENLKGFNPLFTLRYSATHKKDSIYNLIYRLDAMEAYNKKLVKKIAVKGIAQRGTTATEGYLYLEGINLFKDKNPTANLGFEVKQATGVKAVVRKVEIGHNLYDRSGSLEQYRNGFTITQIDGRDNSVTFQNGITLFAGDLKGAVNEQQLRQIQIRETILSHIERERMLYFRGIKVLSLFFIDEVAKYKQYDASGTAFNGSYADLFEEEYNDIVNRLQLKIGEDAYVGFLKSIAAEKTHAGYFSIDKKKNQFVDGKVERSTRESVDTDAYDLIMKDKERLLSFGEPVRFIFSHSALREGWDNPNVFQICTLKQSDAETRKRQEVGRGLRLCVNQEGERMDANFLGSEVHHINQLTVIASESYDQFAKALQTEIAEVIADRPQKVSPSLFRDKVLSDKQGNPYSVSEEAALVLYESLAGYGYVKAGTLTDKYYEDKESGNFQLPEEVEASSESVMNILDSVYNPKMLHPENARGNNVELHFDEQKFNREEFKKLWASINTKTAYVVDFETEELVRKAIQRLNNHLHVSKIFFTVASGVLDKIESKELLAAGEGFKQQSSEHIDVHSAVNGNVKYDLVGKVVAETGLTRNTVVKILTGIEKPVFDQFMLNPEEFILKCSNLINEEKATVIIQHIAYNKLNDSFGTEIFTEPTFKGRLGVNAIPANKHLYDYVIFDSPSVEKPFAEQLDTSSEVSVYVKLPKGFYINTPVGKYNPDWAIAFNEGMVKHIYFVAETKGDISTMELREVESAKISCARKHFQAISSNKVIFDVVANYKQLMSMVK
ncbi:MAG: DEAD/DEAH box helicase family protein [Synergistaceae bacterium]|jgi:type III restriction enzyme|nr:DEAD/DEAH box helicase family protein [Synergistaceae bacterium]